MGNPIDFQIDKAEELLKKMPLDKAFDVVCCTLREEHKKLKAGVTICHKQSVELQKAKNEIKIWREYARSTIMQAPSVQDTLTVIRNYVKKTKRKPVEQRTIVKNMLWDMINSCGIQLPDDLRQEIASLDDLQPRVSDNKSGVFVNGNYIDVHDNKTVNI